MKLKFMILALATLVTVNPAVATPITDTSLIHTLQFDFVNPTSSLTSTNSNFSNTYGYGVDVQAYGDLNSGKVGSRVSGAQNANTQSIATIYDTLTFNTIGSVPVEVLFDFTYEGTLASSAQFENPGSQGFVTIYDITGLDTWLNDSDGLFGGFLGEGVDISDDATFILREEVLVKLGDLTGARDGTLHEFIGTQSGSFMADPSKTYGIQIMSNSFASVNSFSDFLGTGTFEFTNLNGATFDSGSGEFLNQQVSVPEPASVLLLGSGLIGLFGMRKKLPKVSALPS